MTTTHSTHTRSLLAATLVAVVLMLALFVTTSSAGATTVTGGKTTIVLDAAATPLFYAVNFSLYPVAPGTETITPAVGMTLTLPIAGGSYNKATHTGTFKHRGGHMYLRWSGGAWQQHRLTYPWILINGAPEVVALPNGGARANILSVDLATATYTNYVQAGRHWVKITNVKLLWTANGSSLFNGVFGIGVAPGLAFGNATIRARL